MVTWMYRSGTRGQLEFPDFYLPFSGHLDPDNRWIALARLVPWKLVEEIYLKSLCNGFGAPALPARVALGALLIKERLGLTDRETVEAIQENPYLQFFIGREEFEHVRPFDASLMVDFRKRFGEEGLSRISTAVAMAVIQETETPTAPDSLLDTFRSPPIRANIPVEAAIFAARPYVFWFVAKKGRFRDGHWLKATFNAFGRSGTTADAGTCRIVVAGPCFVQKSVPCSLSA